MAGSVVAAERASRVPVAGSARGTNGRKGASPLRTSVIQNFIRERAARCTDGWLSPGCRDLCVGVTQAAQEMVARGMASHHEAGRYGGNKERGP